MSKDGRSVICDTCERLETDVKKFWIVTNDGKDTNHAVTEKVKELLEIAGRSCILCEKDAEKNIIRERIPDMIDCAIVIGGDGSLIEVARTLWKRDVPILGINMGTLGYLTEVEVSNLAEDITQMLKGDYLYEERMMLESMFRTERKMLHLMILLCHVKVMICVLYILNCS